MKRFITIIAIILATAIIGVSSLVLIRTANTPAPVASVVEEVKPPAVAELLTLVNAERARVGVAPLAIDERLNQSAQFKSDDILARNYFAHKDPITGKNNGIAKGAELTGTVCSSIGENITDNIYTNDSQTAVRAWRNSPPHYAAMIDPNNDTTGFGIAGTKITQHFCQLR